MRIRSRSPTPAKTNTAPMMRPGPSRLGIPPDAAEYYILTERTRVPATVPAVAAERIVPDITTIFPQ